MADDRGDRLAQTLERVADAVDEAAAEQRKASRIARRAARGRRTGGINEPTTTRSVRQVLELIGRTAEHLGNAAGGLRRAWAASLAEQGLSIRQIGERMGVTHQRVSALLTHHRQAGESPGRR